MKVVVTRGLHIGKHVYPPGEQEIPDSELRTTLFAKHIKAGHILEPAAAPRRTLVKSTQERAQALLEKVFSKDKANATPEEAAKLSGGVASTEAGAPAESETAEETGKPRGSKPNKPNR